MSAGIDRDQLRLLVREVVRDAMTAQGAPVPPRPASAPAPAGLDTPPPTGPLAADRRSRTDTVRIGSDAARRIRKGATRWTSSIAWNCSSVSDTRCPRSMNMFATERLPEPCQLRGSGTCRFDGELFM